jgi:hypothetical protein
VTTVRELVNELNRMVIVDEVEEDAEVLVTDPFVDMAPIISVGMDGRLYIS